MKNLSKKNNMIIRLTITISIIILVVVIVLFKYTYAVKDDNLLSKLNISIDNKKNLTTTTMDETDVFLKNPYKGFSSEDAYSQVNRTIDWRDELDYYTTEGYIRLNWYLFYKNSFIGPKEAINYKDDAYDWSILLDVIKLYADHDMKLRFGVMTANSVSNTNAINAYKSNPNSMIQYNINTLTDLQMPKGSIVPVADYIPVITMENKKIKLTCGEYDCSDSLVKDIDNSVNPIFKTVDNEVFYKSRNITPMWMFEGIPADYDELGNPIYSGSAVKWYLSSNNLEWMPKWDDPNLINNIENFVTAMSNYLKNEEYKGKKLIEYVSFIETRSYGNYGENHISNTVLSAVNSEFRNPLLCGYLDTSAHNYQYAYEKDSNFTYPSSCYFNSSKGKSTKIYEEIDYYLNSGYTKKYNVNIGFDYYRDKYLQTYIDAFKDTNVKVVFNWYSSWDMDYYQNENIWIHDNTLKSFLEEYSGKVTIRGDSIFAKSFGEGTQFAQINNIAPTSFEYIIKNYKDYYGTESYFTNLNQKIEEKNLCNNKFDCLTTYFINVVENGRFTYMDYNYILYDYYNNYLNGIEDDYTLDLNYLGNSLGYHFIMKQAKFMTRVNLTNDNNLNVNFDVVNDGVTYLYDNDDTKVYIALLETNGNGNVLTDDNNKSVVASKFVTDIKPTTWSSSLDITGNRDSRDKLNWINENASIDVSDVKEGNYILAVGLFTEYDDNYPTIKLGNVGGTNDNWYVLGEVELSYDTYTISYDSNGGTGEMEDSIIKVDENFTLSKNLFTKEGYIFESWNTKKDGSGKSYKDLEEVTNLASSKETIVLYAIWKKVIILVNNTTDYECIYDGNNHTLNVDVSPDNYTIKYSLDKDGYTLDTIPKFKDVGEYTINYKISLDNTNDLYGTNKVKIYGIRKFDDSITVKNNYLILDNNSFIKLTNKIDIYSKITNIKHLDDNKNNINLDNIKTGEYITININNIKDYEYQLAYIGDINGNGEIDIIDYIRIMKDIMEISKLSDIYYEAADVNRNNKIDIIDYIRIMKTIMEEE